MITMTDTLVGKIFHRARDFAKVKPRKRHAENTLKADCAEIKSLSFEVTNRCSASCSFCAYRYMSRPKGVMDMALYEEALIGAVKDGVRGIALGTIVGDPLEDPFLIERIEFAKRMGQCKVIMFYTNLIGLGRFDARKLLLSGLTGVTISTSFSGPEFYKRYFGVDKYGEVIGNMRRLCGLNMSLGRPVDISIELRAPVRLLSHVKKDEVHEEIAPLAHEIGTKYSYDTWFGLIQKKDIPGGCRLIRIDRKRKKLPCKDLYGGNVMIMLDGRATVCGCRNFEGDNELIIGDIRKNSLKDIWTGERIKKIKQDWLEGKIPRICRDCNWYRSV